uniref:Transmembrane protein n=1 Tax=Panagrellus redivivus TaxID=6233 RepID=A0A7E4VEI9_PANRE
MHRQLVRSVSANSRRRFMVIQDGFRDSESLISLTSWSATQNHNSENVEKDLYHCEFRPRRHILLKLVGCLVVFWIVGAALLVSVESGHRKTTTSKESQDVQTQFLQTYWKINKVIPIDTDHWNDTVDHLLQWFENEHNADNRKKPLFGSFIGSWLFAMYFGNAVGGVPGFAPVELSPASRIIATIAAFPSVFLYYWSIFAIARSIRSLPRSAIYCLTGVFILAAILKAWLSAFYHDIFPLLGNGFSLLSVILNYRAFRTAESSIFTACTVLVIHSIFWIFLFALLDEAVAWRQCLYLRVVDRLDAESTLLVTLPELELNRADHLIRRYAQRSILHRFTVAFLTEDDKHKIEKVVSEFQEKSISCDDRYDETCI